MSDVEQKVRPVQAGSSGSNPHDLTPQQRRAGQRLMTQEGAIWAFMNGLVAPGGLVLTAFALYLHADAFAIGLVSALPLLAALVQVWTPQLVRYYGSRKQVCVITLGSARLLLLPLTLTALVAWLLPDQHALWLIIFLAVLTIFSALTAIGGTTWLSWAGTMIPLERRASYFAGRTTLIGALGLVATLMAGTWLDWWTRPTPGGGHETRPETYAAIFGIASLFGIVTVFLLRRTPDLAKTARQSLDRPTLRAAIVESWQHRPLRRFLLFRAAWLFAVTMVVPYYTIFMLQDLRLSFTEISVLQNIGALAGLLSTPLWGRLMDRFGCSRVIWWTSLIKVGYVVLWAVIGPQQAFWPLVVLHLTLVADAGLNLSAGNLLMNLMPHEGTANVGYFSVFAAFTSLASAIGPFLAGLLLSLLGSGSLNLFGFSLGALPLLFVLSGVLRLVSLGLWGGFDDKPTRA